MHLVDNLVSNLVAHIEAEKGETYNVARQDDNGDKDLPLVIVGYDGVEQSGVNLRGHYTVDGFVVLNIVGYDDRANTTGDSIAEDVETIMCAAALAADLTAYGDVHVNDVIVDGFEFNPEGKGNEITLKFRAFIRQF